MSLKTDTKTGVVDIITAHAFNADRTRVALCPNNSEVHIYDTSSGQDAKTWKRLAILTEHSGLVTGIDWCPLTDTIVTAGHDRNAFVWKLVGEEWKPTLCVLRIHRAALVCKWSPNGKKLAVTSAAKCAPICSYEASSDWWLTKMIRKHKSTITDIAWAPNGRLVVTASTDYRCRIISAYDRKLDTKDDQYDELFGDDQYDHGTILQEYTQADSWVNCVSWSPNGMRIAFFGHNCTAHFVDLSKSKTDVQTIYTNAYPMLACQFLSDDVLVATGYDNNPAFFVYDGTQWNFKCFADKPGDEKSTETKQSATSRAFAMFKQADSEGREFGNEAKKASFTKHKNTVNCIRKGEGLTFSTSGLDGNVFIWDAAKYL